MNPAGKWLTMAFVTVVLLSGMRSEAADASVSFDLASAYVYHGYTFNEGPVFQPSVDVSSGHLGFNTWANMDLDDYDGILQSGEFSEVDLTVYWLTTALGMDWCVSYAEYLYPHLATTNGQALAGSREIILSAERALGLGFTAGLRMQYDIDEYDDLYARLSLRYDRTLGKGVDMNASVTGGYAGKRATWSGKGGLHDYGVKLGLEWQVRENLTLNGSVSYTDALDEDVLPFQDVNLYGSIGMSYAM